MKIIALLRRLVKVRRPDPVEEAIRWYWRAYALDPVPVRVEVRRW